MPTLQLPRHRLEPEFRELLSGYDVEDLERARWPAYGMWVDSSLAYFNPAYERQKSPAWGLGSRVLGAMGVIASELERVHERALRSEDPAVFRYACPTPALEREFELRVFALGPDRSGHRGLLATHSLVVERSHASTFDAHEDLYRGADGIIRQCAHCRRTHRRGEDVWDVVPAYIAQIPRMTSHGICPPCAAHYYPGLAA